MSDVVALHCWVCLRRFGFIGRSSAPTRRYYCSPQCTLDRGPDPLEERNDWWRILAAHGVSPIQIGKRWGLHYAHVYRVTKPAA